MSKESQEWYEKTNELEKGFPQSEVPFNLACMYIKRVIRYIDKNTNISPWIPFPKNDYFKKYPKMTKASNRRKYCCFYKRSKYKGVWQVQTKGYQGWNRYWSGWHNIVHHMAHRIIADHTAEHAVLEYKLTQFVYDWGFVDKHLEIDSKKEIDEYHNWINNRDKEDLSAQIESDFYKYQTKGDCYA